MFFLQDKYFFLTWSFQIIGDCSSEERLYIHHHDDALLKYCSFGVCQEPLRDAAEQRLQMASDANSTGSGSETTCWLWWHQDGQHHWALVWCLLIPAIDAKQRREAAGQIMFISLFLLFQPERIASVRFQVIQKISNIAHINRKNNKNTI